jgi:hypothetical protein
MVFAVILGLSGCAREVREAGGASGMNGAYDNPVTWLRAAKQHEEQGDLQRALYEYRLAQTVSLSDGSMRKHLSRVEKEIEQRTAALLRQAERAEARGQQKKARGRYLEILGLQPDHRQALAALREQHKQRSLVGVKKQRELARRHRNDSRENKQLQVYTDEDYTGSWQAIHDAVNRPADAGSLLREQKKHERKKPKDEELRRRLVEKSLARAEEAYQSQQWDNALQYLNLAEQAYDRVDEQRDAVENARKHYARELYKRGVINYRNDPQRALGYWKYALKFNPKDDKTRLRIRSLSRE